MKALIGGKTRREAERALDGPFDIQASLWLDWFIHADEDPNPFQSEEAFA